MNSLVWSEWTYFVCWWNVMRMFSFKKYEILFSSFLNKFLIEKTYKNNYLFLFFINWISQILYWDMKEVWSSTYYNFIIGKHTDYSKFCIILPRYILNFAWNFRRRMFKNLTSNVMQLIWGYQRVKSFVPVESYNDKENSYNSNCSEKQMSHMVDSTSTSLMS